RPAQSPATVGGQRGNFWMHSEEDELQLKVGPSTVRNQPLHNWTEASCTSSLRHPAPLPSHVQALALCWHEEFTFLFHRSRLPLIPLSARSCSRRRTARP